MISAGSLKTRSKRIKKSSKAVKEREKDLVKEQVVNNTTKDIYKRFTETKSVVRMDKITKMMSVAKEKRTENESKAIKELFEELDGVDEEKYVEMTRLRASAINIHKQFLHGTTEFEFNLPIKGENGVTFITDSFLYHIRNLITYTAIATTPKTIQICGKDPDSVNVFSEHDLYFATINREKIPNDYTRIQMRVENAVKYFLNVDISKPETRATPNDAFWVDFYDQQNKATVYDWHFNAQANLNDETATGSYIDVFVDLDLVRKDGQYNNRSSWVDHVTINSFKYDTNKPISQFAPKIQYNTVLINKMNLAANHSAPSDVEETIGGVLTRKRTPFIYNKLEIFFYRRCTYAYCEYIVPGEDTLWAIYGPEDSYEDCKAGVSWDFVLDKGLLYVYPKVYGVGTQSRGLISSLRNTSKVWDMVPSDYLQDEDLKKSQLISPWVYWLDTTVNTIVQERPDDYAKDLWYWGTPSTFIQRNIMFYEGGKDRDEMLASSGAPRNHAFIKWNYRLGISIPNVILYGASFGRIKDTKNFLKFDFTSGCADVDYARYANIPFPYEITQNMINASNINNLKVLIAIYSFIPMFNKKNFDVKHKMRAVTIDIGIIGKALKMLKSIADILDKINDSGFARISLLKQLAKYASKSQAYATNEKNNKTMTKACKNFREAFSGILDSIGVRLMTAVDQVNKVDWAKLTTTLIELSDMWNPNWINVYRINPAVKPPGTAAWQKKDKDSELKKCWAGLWGLVQNFSINKRALKVFAARLKTIYTWGKEDPLKDWRRNMCFLINSVAGSIISMIQNTLSGIANNLKIAGDAKAWIEKNQTTAKADDIAVKKSLETQANSIVTQYATRSDDLLSIWTRICSILPKTAEIYKDNEKFKAVGELEKIWQEFCDRVCKLIITKDNTQLSSQTIGDFDSLVIDSSGTKYIDKVAKIMTIDLTKFEIKGLANSVQDPILDPFGTMEMCEKILDSDVEITSQFYSTWLAAYEKWHQIADEDPADEVLAGKTRAQYLASYGKNTQNLVMMNVD